MKNKSQNQVAVLVFHTTETSPKNQSKIDELFELTRSANIRALRHFEQIQKKPNRATFLGSGKVEEIRNFVQQNQVDLVIFYNNLTGSQTRNIQRKVGVPVLDRNQLILKIFADRARSHIGRLQVELAQKLDELTRIRGAWLGSLSRQAGGKGTRRGPGEKALEMDRRQIQKRIQFLRKKMKTLKRSTQQQRKLRSKNQVCQFALVGYTNSGKSSLLTQMSLSKVKSQDQLFLTLDPTTKKVFIPGIMECVMTDTVGFIQNLPPQLIDAFNTTLEESGQADVLVHVIDLSSPNMEEQMQVVNRLISNLGWGNKPIIHVYNKSDKATLDQTLSIASSTFRAVVSAYTGQGITHLKKEMKRAFLSINKDVELFFPTSEERHIYSLNRNAHIYKTEKSRGGTLCYAQLSPSQLSHWQSFILDV